MLKFLRNIFSFSGGRKKPLPGNYFIATATQSNDRVRRLGLSLPPEGGSAILDRSRLSIPVTVPEQDKEYKPSPYFEWVIDVDPGEGGFFAREDVSAIFDLPWRQSFRGAWVYGLSLTQDRWTYALSGDGPERFGRLQIGVDLLKFYGDSGFPDPVRLQDCFETLTKKLQSRRMPRMTVEVSIAEPVEAAALRAKELIQLKRKLHGDVVIALKSDIFYPGRLAWDILTETGLSWGDGDLFHWDNGPRGYGDDRFFSVWTSTAPGYFFPEAIKAGTFNPTDLVFGYWVGRSADPLGVFEVLVEAVEYCRQHLSGVLLGQDGQPFEVDKERSRLEQIVNEMAIKGVPPGSNKALRMFQ